MMRVLILMCVLWPVSVLAQPICFCLECLNPRINSFYMPAGSMKPTLEIDECFAALSYADGETPIQGEVVVFEHPVNGSTFVKRVIALGGQTVEVRDSRLVIDGVEVPWRQVGTYLQADERQGHLGLYARCPDGLPPCDVPLIEETLNGVTYRTLDLENQGPRSLDSTGLFTVPAGHVFMMGDNRDNSLDSRTPQARGGIGFVPVEMVLGRVLSDE